MIIVGVVLLVLVVGAVAAVAVARLDVPGVPGATVTTSAQPLPSGPVGAADVHDLRFNQAVRGYRMEQVDAALARLAGELAERDAEIDRLRHEQEGPEVTATVPDPGDRDGAHEMGGTR